MPVSDSAGPRREAGGFLAALFDLSFASFITLKLIRWLYMLGALSGVLVAIAVIVAAFNINSGLGVVALLLSPVVFLLVLVWTRVSL